MLNHYFLQPKKIIKRIQEPHPQFLNNAFVDPYSGCEFGCLYCYGIKEDILDEGEGPSPFKVGIKTSCAAGLKKECAAFPSSVDKPASIGIGFASDPYQPCEEEFRLSQRCLEILAESGVPIQIITKSELVLRDAKILAELSEKGLCVVSVSLFTLNEKISRIFEPRVPPPSERLELIQRLRRENIAAGAVLMPIVPYLSDSEDVFDEIFAALRSRDALYCVPGILSLKQLHVRRRVLKLLREKFPYEHDRIDALYGRMGEPHLQYCEKIEKSLKECSEKYQIPTVLPVEGIKPGTRLIVKDVLK